MWPKLKSSLRKGGSPSPRQQVGSCVGNKLSVNEEYMEAFRTKSYIDIWSKVQDQLRTCTTSEVEKSSPLSPFQSYARLSDFLLEPRQEILIELIENSHLHHLLIDYFDGSLEACRICELLLHRINQTRNNYCIIQRIMNLTKTLPAEYCDYTDDQCRIIFRELDSFATLDNPLSDTSPVQFRLLHERYGLMLKQLTLKRRRIIRRGRLIRLSKNGAGLSLVIACGALAVATLVLAVHTLIGIVAAPGILTFSVAFMKKKLKSARIGLKTSKLARLEAQLDAAAKGVFILNRDFDTISRLVVRLHDEIEHGKAIARMCLRSQKRQILEVVVKDFETHESCFLEQLGELEEHVYLSFLTINRARRLVIQEIMVHPQ
ncbi:PREDICTED: UPF0496 protein At1g20180 [Nelumbo nucifera]|uniref:UPF0496 protein At1g20180 n=1 Tax=Nelumbo nucifera TaxID=4432 RepID=A0A1U8A7H5_NELNU|nr:PREDICTED: UPF0496 protein At1g20180 [Nelumbo nucifera]